MNNGFASIAIAGAWGYIGRKVLEAARRRGLRVYALDPGPPPADLDPTAVIRVADPAEFYRLPADLFHLALHPADRRPGQAALLERAQSEPIAILNEKPMVAPEYPTEAAAIIDAVDRGRGLMLYDFLELFDPLTRRITDYLAGFRHVELEHFDMVRSKDREDPALPRNYKWMVPIQYQESVHCLAYVLYLVATLRGGLEAALADGFNAAARAEPYCPPNPAAYAHAVDGRCSFRLSLGPVGVDGVTSFKRHSPWSKRRVIKGRGDGRPFVIEADYLEGKKYLRINGVEQPGDAAASPHEAILDTFAAWRSAVPREELLRGAYPNPRLAWLAFQMSNVLWQCCHNGRAVTLADAAALSRFDSGYAAAQPHFPRYDAPAPPG